MMMRRRRGMVAVMIKQAWKRIAGVQSKRQLYGLLSWQLGINNQASLYEEKVSSKTCSIVV